MLVIPMMISSQVMTTKWYENAVAGGTYSDEAVDVTTDDAGNVFSVATINNGSNLDIKVMAFDPSGTPRWSQTYNSGSDESALNIHCDAAGSVYVSGNKTVSSVNQFFLIKYRSNGTQAWVRNTTPTLGATASASDLSGAAVVITGTVNVAVNDNNVMTVKYDTAGTLSWTRYYDGALSSTDYDEGTDVVIKSTTGEIYVSGAAEGVTTSSDFLALKYNSSGTLQWSTTRDYNTGSTSDYGHSIAIGGIMTSFAVYVTGRGGAGNDVVTMKFNDSGVLQWDTAYVSSNNAAYTDNYFYGGNIYTAMIDNGGGSGTTRIIKYNASGIPQWNTQLGTGYSNIGARQFFTVYDGDLYSLYGGGIKRISISTGAVLETHNECSQLNSLLAADHGVVTTGRADGYDSVCTFEICIPDNNLSITSSSELWVCEDDTISLIATGAAEYMWTASSTNYTEFINSDSSYIELYFSLAGDYYVYVNGYDQYGCPTNADTVLRHSMESPERYSNMISNTLPLEFCSGGYTLLNVSRYYDSDNGYDWFYNGVFAGVTDTVFTATQAGSYWVEVYDLSTFCSVYTEVEVVSFITNPPVVNLGADEGVCQNQSLLLNGMNNGLYLWSTGETTQEIEVTAPGSYLVTFTVPGCTPSYDTFNVTHVIPVIMPDLGPDTTLCGANSFRLDAGSGYVDYYWRFGFYGRYFDVHSSGLYYVDVTTAEGCELRDSINVNFNKVGYLNAAPDTGICSGNPIMLHPEWILHPTDSFNFGEDISTHAYTSGGNVSLSNNGCIDNAMYVGGATGATGFVQIELNVTPGTDMIVFDIYNNAYEATIDFTIDGVSYTEQFIDNSCTADSIRFVNMSAATADGKIVVRLADNNTSSYLDRFRIDRLKVYSEFSPATAYAWYDDQHQLVSSSLTTMVSPSETTTYTFEYTGDGCTFIDSAVVLVESVDLGSDVEACAGDVVTLDAGSGYISYAWSSGETTQTIHPVSSGDYRVTVVHPSCGVLYDTLHVSFHSMNKPALGNDTTLCAGASLTLDAGSANTYLWNNGHSGSTLTVSASGTYVVDVTDVYGCSASDTITISVVALPVVDLGHDTIVCDSLVLYAGTHHAFEWNSGETNQQLTASSSGLYWVEVEDMYGCASRDSIHVTVYQTPVLDLLTSNPAYPGSGSQLEACDGETILLDAENPGASYQWSNGTSMQTLQVSTSNTWFVTVTDPSGHCHSISSVETYFHSLPSGMATVYESSCTSPTGAISLSVSGGTAPYNYLWSNGAVTDSIGNLAFGTYDVIISDLYGCTDSVTVTVNEANAPAIVTSVQDVMCYGDCNGSAAAIPSGGTMPYHYLWSTGDTLSDIDNLCTGNYDITVTDNAGCSGISSVSVDEPLELTASTYSTSETASGMYDGIAWIIPSGGTPPYEYLWSNSASEDTISGLASGTYGVTVTDDHGCTWTGNVLVDVNTLIATLDDDIRVFPNPVSAGWTQVSGLNCSDATEVRIAGTDGRFSTVEYQAGFIRLTDYRPGMYVLQILCGNKIVHVQKLLLIE